MKMVGQIIDNVSSIVATRNSSIEREVLLRIVQESYYELAQRGSWAPLRSSFELDFSDGTTEKWLPSDLIGIDAVVGDVNTGYREYLPRDESDVDYDETTYRYYFSEIATTPVAEGDDLSISRGTTTFTADSLDTDYTNDYMVLATQPGFYKLTAQTTIENTYYGDTLQDAHYQIRPPGTKKISAVTPSRYDTTETLTCYYWRYPPPVFRETDIILIPAYRALELMVAIRYVGERHKQSFKSNDFRKELLGQNMDGETGELAQALKMNPNFNPPTIPKDIQGNRYDLGRNRFARRTGIVNNQLPGSDAWRGYFNR